MDFGNVVWVGASRVAVLAAVVLATVVGEAWAQSARRRGSFSDGGVYACGVRFGGSLAHRRVQVGADINDWLRAEKEKGHLTVVQLDDGRKWRGGEESHAQLRHWLERTELGLIDILHFCEENSHDAPSWLDPLYDIVKEHDADLPVYVWYSMPLGPGSEKADGYWYDFYGQGYTSFRDKVRQYLATGKPLGMTVDCSLYSSLETAREQVMVCREFDLPVNYFAAHHGAGHCTGWYQGNDGYALFVPARNVLFTALELQRRSKPPWSLGAGDFFWGNVIELSPDAGGRVEQAWSGLGQATVYGFQGLNVSDGMVGSAGVRPLSLDYQFWSLLPIENCRLELVPSDGKALPKVEMSRCGAPGEWRALNAGESDSVFAVEQFKSPLREFRLRLTFDTTEAGFAGARLCGDAVVPEDKEVALYPEFYHGWRRQIQYQQRLEVGLWRALSRIDGGNQLEPGPAVAMRGAPGRAISTEVVQRFTSEQPLNDIVVRLEGSHNSANLGGSTGLAVSLDGENVLVEGVPEGIVDSSGRWSGWHSADLREARQFAGIREFHVHLRQRNGSGIRSHISSRLQTLEVTASVGRAGVIAEQ